jgi:alkylated DNA nucleotide flippase Atl1
VNATLRPVFARPFQLSGRRTEEPVDLDRLWDKPVLRHVRNAVATIRALAFVMSVVASAAVLIYLAIRNYVGSPALAITLGIMLVALLAGSGYIWHYVKNIHGKHSRLAGGGWLLGSVTRRAELEVFAVSGLVVILCASG